MGTHVTPSALFVTTVSITLEAFLTPFATYFRATGWRIDALSNGATTNTHIEGCFDQRFDVAWSRNPLAPANLIGAAATVREVVSAGKYDIVHVHTPVAAFVTRYALRKAPASSRPTLIYTAHGFHFYKGGSRISNALFLTMERLAAHWTDYLVTINAEDFDAAERLRGIPPERVRLIPGIGVDIERYGDDRVAAEDAAAVRRELGVAPDAFMLTMIAEFAPVKRHGHVLIALGQVRDPRVVLVLVGTGPLESQLREKVQELGLQDRVRFAGYRRDIPEVLRASDALVLASEREGLPRSVLEAMAAGRPVLGTQTRGIADAVGTDAGWIAPKHDSAALAAAIDAAAADPVDLRRRGQAARTRATSEFALPRIIHAYEELYREALASRV
jgi:glycosyltransferase involved in cell wall biosynthesis